MLKYKWIRKSDLSSLYDGVTDSKPVALASINFITEPGQDAAGHMEEKTV